MKAQASRGPTCSGGIFQFVKTARQMVRSLSPVRGCLRRAEDPSGYGQRACRGRGRTLESLSDGHCGFCIIGANLGFAI
jgi:hypothetical protein